MGEYILGLDAGTTSLKAAVFQKNGTLVVSGVEDYTLQTPGAGLVELPAECYWEHLCCLIRRILAEGRLDPHDIVSLAISSQGETLICMDEAGQPLRPAIVWLDNRSEKEAEEIGTFFGRKAIYEHTGQPESVATWPATKIAWLRRHQPEVFAASKKYLLLEDYLIYRLTGVYACEENLLASSLLYDINGRCWWKEMLEYLGIREDQLPTVYGCGEKIAFVSAEAAAETGLSENILVAAGALDQTCGIIGAGRILPGTVTETTGSCLAVSANLDHFVPYDENVKITCQNHAVPGRYVVLLWSQTAGMVLKWFVNQFYQKEKEETENVFRLADQEAEKAPPGSDGLVMLPHLSGASNPEYNSQARGVFYGVTMEHGRGHFSRAILEAVAYMLRRNLEQIESMEQKIDVVYSMGGGSKSDLWNQIKADATGKKVETLCSQESACLGAALLGAVAAGLYPNIDAAAAGMAEAGRVFVPDEEKKIVYDRGFENYLDLYETLVPLFAKYSSAGKRQ